MGERAPDPRALAWHVLQRVDAGGYADVLIGRAFARYALAPADRALAVRLIYGTIAWQLYLDHLLAGFCHRPLADLGPAIRVLLRMAMFQICLLDRVPAFAAVNSAVTLAKSYRHGAAAGFVNAVLRRASIGWRGVPLPARERDLAGYLSVRYSHPRWLVELWLDEMGAEETEALLQANNEPAPTVLRVNLLRATREDLLTRLSTAGIEVVPGMYSPAAVEVRGIDPAAHALYAQGLYSVQGEAAQLISYLVAPRPGERVLDLCAAPGGKTLHLAELMHNRGTVVALDTNAKGVARIAAEARRLGMDIVEPRVADAREFRWQPTLFDRVLLDAPCTGFGTLRQHPEIRWRRTPESVRELAALQDALLEAASRLVRIGGLLVYATCTRTRTENDDLVANFLARHPDFVLQRRHDDLPASLAGLLHDGILRTAPHCHGLDGFFAVRLLRTGSHDNVAP